MTYRFSLNGGSPLREDDGGEGDPPASTAAPRYAVTIMHVILALCAGIPWMVLPW